MNRISHIPTYDTSKAPDRKVATDFYVIERPTYIMIRHNNDEEAVRVKGHPVRFESRDAAIAYARKHSA